MNMMNGWTLMENLSRQDRDSAIRQFCAARVEEQEQQEQEVEIINTGCTPSTEVEEQLVDTFFNAEYYDKENDFKHPQDELASASFFDDHLQQDDVPLVYDQSNSSRMMIQAAGNDDDVVVNSVDEGLQLVHLLLGCRDARLAHSILTQIWPRLAPWGRGDSLHRVSLCFAMALNSRLSLVHNRNPNGSFSSRPRPTTIDVDDDSRTTREEKSEAFALLHQTTPYIAFGFAAANDAICQAASGKDSLHIIDLGMEHNLQWPSLLHTLSTSPKSRRSMSVRISGLIGDQEPTQLEISMRRLCKEAAALGISLEFKLLREQVSPSTLTREKLQLRDEEALFVNSIMQLHKESRGSLKAILHSIKRLSPVVEQDANHNGPFFVGRFLEYYSAIFDSLDASLPRNSDERMKIERYHLGEEIWNVVACEGGKWAGPGFE